MKLEKIIFSFVFLIFLSCNKEESVKIEYNSYIFSENIKFYSNYNDKMDGNLVLPSSFDEYENGIYPKLTISNNGKLSGNFDIEFHIDIFQGQNTTITFQMVLENIKSTNSVNKNPISIIVSSLPDLDNNFKISVTPNGGSFQKMAKNNFLRDGVDSMFNWQNMLDLNKIPTTLNNVFSNNFKIKIKRRNSLMNIEIFREIETSNYLSIYKKELEVNNSGNFFFEWLNSTDENSNFATYFFDTEFLRKFKWKDEEVFFNYL